MNEAMSSGNLPQPRFRYTPLIKAGPFYKTTGMIALDWEFIFNADQRPSTRTSVGVSSLPLGVFLKKQGLGIK